MRMKPHEIMKKVRKLTGLKNYGLRKELLKRGCEITIQGLDYYNEEKAKKMSPQVMFALDEIVQEITGKKGQVIEWARQ